MLKRNYLVDPFSLLLVYQFWALIFSLFEAFTEFLSPTLLVNRFLLTQAIKLSNYLELLADSVSVQ
jgi:hypothetical protein